MRGENARLGVETTTRSDHIARSATKPRSSSSTDQRHSARPDRSWLEKAQHSGPRIGSSSKLAGKNQHGGPRIGSSSAWNGLYLRLADNMGLRTGFESDLNAIHKTVPIPRFDGTVDIYSFQQSS